MNSFGRVTYISYESRFPLRRRASATRNGKKWICSFMTGSGSAFTSREAVVHRLADARRLCRKWCRK